MTEVNVQSRFTATGLVPYMPKIILSIQSPVAQMTRPALAKSTGSAWVTKMPQANLKEMKRQVGYMQVQPSTEFPQPSKGFKAAIIAQAQLAAALKENERQKQKCAKRRTIIAQSGSSTIREGQELIHDRDLAAQIRNEARIRRKTITDASPSNVCSTSLQSVWIA